MALSDKGAKIWDEAHAKGHMYYKPSHPSQNDYIPPKGHDKHLADHERAHTGNPGANVRHGADAVGKVRSAPRIAELMDRRQRSYSLEDIDPDYNPGR